MRSFLNYDLEKDGHNKSRMSQLETLSSKSMKIRQNTSGEWFVFQPFIQVLMDLSEKSKSRTQMGRPITGPSVGSSQLSPPKPNLEKKIFIEGGRFSGGRINAVMMSFQSNGTKP